MESSRRTHPESLADKMLTVSFVFAQVSYVTPDPPASQQHADDGNHEVETMKPRFERVVLVPLLTEYLAHIRETKAPRKGSGKRINNEALQVHPRDAGGKSDEGADGGKQTADKNDNLAVVSKPAIGHVEVVRGN